MTAGKEKALDRLLAVVAEIRDVLETLEDINAEHYDLSPDEDRWDHVGDVERTLAGLKEVLAVIRGEVK